jgi:hypothetical protein
LLPRRSDRMAMKHEFTFIYSQHRHRPSGCRRYRSQTAQIPCSCFSDFSWWKILGRYFYCTIPSPRMTYLLPVLLHCKLRVQTPGPTGSQCKTIHDYTESYLLVSSYWSSSVKLSVITPARTLLAMIRLSPFLRPSYYES